MRAIDSIRVVIVDDYDVVREGLAGFLKAFKSFELVGEARCADEARDLCEAVKPDVVLLDLALTQMNGVDVIQSIRAASPQSRIIVFADYEGDDWIQLAVQAGAVGYVLKNASIHDIAAAIVAASGA